MALLEKWRGSRELDRFRSEFDDLLERFGFDRDWFSRWPFDRGFFGEREVSPARPAIDSCIEGDKFIVRSELPGIDPKNIEIKVVGDILQSRVRVRKNAKARRRTTSDVRSATARSSVRCHCSKVSRRKT
jgi:HSP20 family molecular chaperone IbpA